MAGIGFELRRAMRSDSYANILQSYALAGVIGSGPWLISIGSLVVIGFIERALSGDTRVATQFFAAVTWLISASLVGVSGPQLLLVRFSADRLFEKKPEQVLPNLLGALLLTTVLSALLGTVVTLCAFPALGATSVLLPCVFVVLCNVWVLTGQLSGSKAYLQVFALFCLGYALSIVSVLFLERFGMAGLLLGFLAGHGVMLFGMLSLIARAYPSNRRIAFAFLKKGKSFRDLLWVGFFFSLAVWIDKYVFWLNPVTSEPVLGPIRYSIVYDLPISIAYLSVVPGMAVFLVRIETDFAQAYERFYAAVREGGTLLEIRALRGQLVQAARDGIHDILRVQGLAAAILVIASERVLRLLGIPAFYSYLLRFDLVATAFQVVLLGIVTLLFYLDYRRLVLLICVLFAALNLGLSVWSQELGPRFFGLGFAASVAVTTLIALGFLSSKLDKLDYETFMR
jgi:uncharacterized membrane protein